MAPGLTIVLLGNSGVGKSASGNTILGQPAFESRRSFRSVTTQISKQDQTVFGKRISVVDTPGILGSEREIENWHQEFLRSSSPCLYLVVVKIDRFTIEQKNAVAASLRVIGDQQFSNCYLLFTGGDDLNNMSLDEFINEHPEGLLPPLIERFAGRLHLFNNEHGGPEQVRELLVKSGHLITVDRPRMDRRVVLLGLPGGGKSSSGNTILGSDQFKSGSDFGSVSTETVSRSAVVEGRQVTVVDTPGFTDEVLTPKQLYEEIMKTIVKASPGPHAFIIVVRIGRISRADIKLFELLPKLMRDALKYAMVLFTHGDGLRGQSIEDLIRSNSHVSGLVSLCGGRFSVFDNGKRGNRVQVRNLLDKIDAMVAANGEQYCTSDTMVDKSTWEALLDWFKNWLKELVELIRSLSKSGYYLLNAAH